MIASGLTLSPRVTLGKYVVGHPGAPLESIWVAKDPHRPGTNRGLVEIDLSMHQADTGSQDSRTPALLIPQPRRKFARLMVNCRLGSRTNSKKIASIPSFPSHRERLPRREREVAVQLNLQILSSREIQCRRRKKMRNWRRRPSNDVRSPGPSVGPATSLQIEVCSEADVQRNVTLVFVPPSRISVMSVTPSSRCEWTAVF